MLQMHQERNLLMQCPLERSHLIRQYKIAKHIVLCLKSHPKVDRFRCPFNKTHLVESMKAQYHLENCESSGNVYNSLYVAEPQKNVGTVTLEEACSLQPQFLDEDWDAGYATYSPLKMTENQEVTRLLQCVPKSEKKAFRRMERERFASLQKQNNGMIVLEEEKKEDHEAPLRVPKAMPKSISLNNSFAKESSFNAHKATMNSNFAKSLSACIGQSSNEKENRTLKNKSMDEQALNSDDNIGFSKRNAFKNLYTTNNTKAANTSCPSINIYSTPEVKATGIKDEIPSNKDTSCTAKDTSNERNFETYRDKSTSDSSDDSSSSDSDSASEDSPDETARTFSLPRMRKMSKKLSMGRGLAILYNKERIEVERETSFQVKSEMSNCSIDGKKFGYED